MTLKQKHTTRQTRNSEREDERKKERIEDQLTKQSFVKHPEAVMKIIRSEDWSQDGFLKNTHSDQGKSDQSHHNPKNKENTDQNHQIEGLGKEKNNHKIPT